LPTLFPIEGGDRTARGEVARECGEGVITEDGGESGELDMRMPIGEGGPLVDWDPGEVG
jgi:hypothetical protein